jgi:hypothetical protein
MALAYYTIMWSYHRGNTNFKDEECDTPLNLEAEQTSLSGTPFETKVVQTSTIPAPQKSE